MIATRNSFNGIRPGDRVVMQVPAGRGRDGQEYAQRAGRCVMAFDTHVVINLGGRFGTPGVCDDSNYVKHSTAKVVDRVNAALKRENAKRADTLNAVVHSRNLYMDTPEGKRRVIDAHVLPCGSLAVRDLYTAKAVPATGKTFSDGYGNSVSA